MKAEFILVGDYAINVEQVTAAHWENGKLFVHLVGGRFEKFEGDEGQRLWDRMKTRDELELVVAGSA
jgi:hypothetical protein